MKQLTKNEKSSEKVLNSEKNKKVIIVANAFSVTMVKDYSYSVVEFEKLTLEQAKELIRNSDEIVSIIGHEGTAKIYSQILEIPLQANRVFYQLSPNEILLVGSLSQRLPEGKILNEEELKNISIEWFLIKLKEKSK